MSEIISLFSVRRATQTLPRPFESRLFAKNSRKDARDIARLIVFIRSGVGR